MPGRPRRDTCRSESRSRVTSVTCQSDTNSRVSPLPSDAETQARDETEELREQLRFRVCLMGEAQVGKTSLVSQFLTSEYMNTYDASLGIVGSLGSFIIEYWITNWFSVILISFYEKILLTDDEYGEKTVSVSLDGQEAELNFIDHPSNEMGVSVECWHVYVAQNRWHVIPGPRWRTSFPRTSPRPAWWSTPSLTRRATSRPRRPYSIWRHRRENLESEERKYWYLSFLLY